MENKNLETNNNLIYTLTAEELVLKRFSYWSAFIGNIFRVVGIILIILGVPLMLVMGIGVIYLILGYIYYKLGGWYIVSSNATNNKLEKGEGESNYTSMITAFDALTKAFKTQAIIFLLAAVLSTFVIGVTAGVLLKKPELLKMNNNFKTEINKEKTDENKEKIITVKTIKASLNQPAKTDNVNITVTSIDKSIPSYSSEKDMIQVNFDFSNVASKDIYFASGDFTLKDSDNNVYEDKLNLELTRTKSFSNLVLAPTGKSSGTLYFQTNKNAKDVRLVYNDYQANSQIEISLY
jgi:hypothetical protein